MSGLGTGVDPLEVDLLVGDSLGLGDERLAEGDKTLLWSENGSTKHDVVLVDDTVSWESSHWGDGLLGKIELGGSVVLSFLSESRLSNTVDLVVDDGTVMESLLSSTSDSEGDTRWMPSSNTGDLAETLVRLARKLLGVPSAGDSLESVTSGNSDGVNHLILSEDGINLDLFLEMLASPVDLLLDGSSVDLDFDEVSLLLATAKDLHLSVSDHTDRRAVLLQLGEISLDELLSILILPLLGVLGESLLLGFSPVAVEATTSFLGQVLGPDGGKSTWSLWGVDVSGNSSNNHWWGLDDGDGFDNLLLVNL